MTILNIIQINKAMDLVSEAGKSLPPKTKWNLAKNLRLTGNVAAQFEEQRVKAVRAHAGDGEKLDASSPAWDQFQTEMKALLNVEEDISLLKLPFEEVAALEIAASVLSVIEPILEGAPA